MASIESEQSTRRAIFRLARVLARRCDRRRRRRRRGAGISPEEASFARGAGAAETVRVQGEIKQSTRGRGSGPVRLDVQSDDGAAVAILLISDASLDSLGLSLKAGERIDARGAMVAGKKPLLVATEVTVEGKVIEIRESEPGKQNAPAPPAAPSGSPQGLEASP
jgi:hypothetical protein